MSETKFSKEHEWATLEGETAVVGITGYAQNALGDIVSIELPEKGKRFNKGESLVVVDSMKASSDVYAPLSGEVVEVNEGLNENPQWINESPEEKGWVVKLKVKDASEMEKLLTKEEYEKYLKEQK